MSHTASGGWVTTAVTCAGPGTYRTQGRITQLVNEVCLIVGGNLNYFSQDSKITFHNLCFFVAPFSSVLSLLVFSCNMNRIPSKPPVTEMEKFSMIWKTDARTVCSGSYLSTITTRFLTLKNKCFNKLERNQGAILVNSHCKFLPTQSHIKDIYWIYFYCFNVVLLFVLLCFITLLSMIWLFYDLLTLNLILYFVRHYRNKVYHLYYDYYYILLIDYVHKNVALPSLENVFSRLFFRKYFLNEVLNVCSTHRPYEGGCGGRWHPETEVCVSWQQKHFMYI